MNEINILNCLSILVDRIKGSFLNNPSYEVNSRKKVSYYPNDGIYPKWAIFVDTISKDLPRKGFLSAALDRFKKYVERIFEVRMPW